MLLCSAESAMAVPAYPGIIKVKQADGTVLSVRLHGDERVNFMTTDDGYPIMLNRQTGNYEYATLSGSTLRTSGIVATDASMRTPQAKQFLVSYDKSATLSAAKAKSMNANVLMQQTDTHKRNAKPKKTLTNNFPHTGEQHSIVILMEFKDKKFSTMDNPQQYYTNAMNQQGFTAENGANGSARDFFIASSNGMFSPTFDVYGPVQINYNQHDAGQGTYNTKINMGTFVKAAIEGLDDEVDFSKYDHDGDGFVDNVYIYYAGNGAADSDDAQTIWPMRSTCASGISISPPTTAWASAATRAATRWTAHVRATSRLASAPSCTSSVIVWVSPTTTTRATQAPTTRRAIGTRWRAVRTATTRTRPRSTRLSSDTRWAGSSPRRLLTAAAA